MNQSYIITDGKELKRLFDESPSVIKNLIKGGEVKNTTTILGQKYTVQISNYTPLSNIITCILIGALDPKNVVTALKDLVGLDDENATKLAQDLEKSILEKARDLTLGKETDTVAVLTFEAGNSKEELRKEIMDTTKRESALVIPQTSGIPKKQKTVTPGSRSQLIEQLQILSSIPDDEEVEERLKKIQEQINSIKKKEDTNTLESNIALKSFMFGEQGKEPVKAISKTATYSVAPTHYNLDPYREVAEE